MVEFSSHPGMRERFLQRCQNNPLFPERRRWVTQFEVNQAQRDDLRERERFLVRFRKAIESAGQLPGNVDSQRVLDLKEELDQLYQAAATLPGEMDEYRAMIRRLVEVIMRAVRKGAGEDATARRKLDEEDLARAEHYRLQDLPLVADLMHEDSPITGPELAPTLLSASEGEFEAALGLFAGEQLQLLFHQAEQLLQQLDAGRQRHPGAWQRLARIAANLSASIPGRVAQ